MFNLLGGEPEYLDPLKDEAPVGWWVTGYPWYAIETPEHKRFRDAYQAKYNDYPRLGSVVGYSAVKAAAAAIRKAGSTDTEKLVAAMSGLALRFAVRQGHLPPARPPVDDGRLRRSHGGEGRQGRDGRLALRRRRQLPALRRHGQAVAAGRLIRALCPAEAGPTGPPRCRPSAIRRLDSASG